MSNQTTLSKYWKLPSFKTPSSSSRPSPSSKGSSRVTTNNHLKEIADETLAAIKKGSYTLDSVTYDLAAPTSSSRKSTQYYAPDSALLSSWATSSQPGPPGPSSQINFLKISTLDGARYASVSLQGKKIGVLNFASAKNPGGGFLRGTQAQEESLARSSTLYPTLMTSTSQRFYTLHNRDLKNGMYSHATIYSPGCLLFRGDDGQWLTPVQVDILTSAAVNAGVVRCDLGPSTTSDALEESIEQEMKERMARILFLFQQQGAQALILGSFGTGVFQNHVEMVARLWADLLTVPGARFKDAFPHIIFAILGDRTFKDFETVFNSRTAGTWDPMDES
ncbi:hypothetical protein C8J56DRAFT_917858 [Mycena floridula]|nr:hypothetical protein C8J56DRAFT_917858 [Mycena floridula]